MSAELQNEKIKKTSRDANSCYAITLLPVTRHTSTTSFIFRPHTIKRKILSIFPIFNL